MTTSAGDERPFWSTGAGASTRAGWRTRLAALPRTIRGAGPAGWLTALVVAAAVVLLAKATSPSLWFRDTAATGGDTGAHVWGPAFLRDELLPRFRLSGWAPDWYAGFPAYRFYMVLPALAVVALDLVVPYNVAFKLVTVSGVLALPVAGWALGRLARLPFPLPALLAAFTATFVLDTNFSIYGGNLASTLAGEFSFTIALAAALVYIGLLLRGLADGTLRGWAGVALAVTVLCHPIPAIFALGATVVATAVTGADGLRPRLRPLWILALLVAMVAWALAVGRSWPLAVQIGAALVTAAVGVALILSHAAGRVGRRRLWWVASVGVLGGLLASFWALPFWWNRGVVNDMGWEKLTRFVDNLLQPHETVDGGKVIVVFLLLAGLGGLWGLLRWDVPTVTLTVLAVGFALGFVVWPQEILWNARLLPFWYLCVYLLAAVGVGRALLLLRRAAVLLARGVRAEQVAVGGPDAPGGPDPVLVGRRLALGLLAVVALGWWVHSAQPLRMMVPGDAGAGGTWGIPGIRTADSSFIPGWARWNYRGVEGKDAYPDYYRLVETMAAVGEERGCGRAMWEYGLDELERFGTPMAPMLLPHFTDGCIGSMEGLYFEASATVPYHFLVQDELSARPSRPMRDLPYPHAVDVAAGVDHLQLLGVRYYLAFSAETVTQAHAEPRLTPVARSGVWTVFEVDDVALVEPLRFEPVVSTALGHAGRDWTDPSVDWFLDPGARDVFLTADGPDGWAEVDGETPPPRTPVEAAAVDDVVTDTDRIAFTVDRVGVPVLVRTSWFPNWEVSGADGPYRVTPNLMVVVPSDREVSLAYTRSPIEWTGIGLSALGLVLLVVVRGRRLDLAGHDDRLSDEELWYVGEAGLAVDPTPRPATVAAAQRSGPLFRLPEDADPEPPADDPGEGSAVERSGDGHAPADASPPSGDDGPARGATGAEDAPERA